MSITLTATIGHVDLDIGPAALPEAEGGVAVRLTLFDGPMILTLTRQQAAWVAGAIDEELTASTDGGVPVDRLRSFYRTA